MKEITDMNFPENSRRQFLQTLGAGAALSSLGVSSGALAQSAAAAPASAITGPFTLPALPYDQAALAPVISATTIGIHYGKHHKAYADFLNKAAADKEQFPAYRELLSDKSLEALIRASAGKPDAAALFNNAGQLWNHTFYWNSLKAKGGGKPGTRLARMIDESFGSFDAFKTQLAATANGQFGSGWGWLVLDGSKLKVMRTSNAEVPFTQGMKPLLTIDVWEHAYYIDFQNRRVEYTTAVIDKLINWEFAEKNLG
jgi:superoxide dismutase, Fe-Mn family